LRLNIGAIIATLKQDISSQQK
jgi:hypothetical protein